MHRPLSFLRDFLVATLLFASFTPTVRADVPHPNIVYIVADDLDFALFQRAGGLRKVLGDQGTTFDRHYVSLPMCCPSRATTLRGQYGHNTGVLANAPPNGGFWKFNVDGLESSTVATWLRAGGYRTALVGKYLNGYGVNAPVGYVPPGWDWWVSPSAGAPYTQFNYTLNVNGQQKEHAALAQDYLDDVLADHAAQFIRTSTDGRPFFLYFAPYNPHAPTTPPPRYSTVKWRDGRWRPASYDEADPSDKAAWIRDMPPLPLDRQRKMDLLYARRLTSMLTLRDEVRTILKVLEETGHLDDTYLFFTSDNGFHLGEHRLGSGKSTAYDEDIHVPLVVRGPGIAAGAHVDALTVNADFAPTFAAMAGVEVPAWVDGRSFAPLLTGGPLDTWRDAILLEGAEPPVVTTVSGVLEPPEPYNPWHEAPPLFRGLRTRTHTYIEYANGEKELYDDDVDPAQISSLAASTGTAELEWWHGWLASLVYASGAGLRTAEIAPPPVTPAVDPPPPDPPPSDPPPSDPPPSDPPPSDPPPSDPPPSDPPPADPPAT